MNHSAIDAILRATSTREALGLAPGESRPEFVLNALRQKLREIAAIDLESDARKDQARGVLHDAAGSILAALERKEPQPRAPATTPPAPSSISTPQSPSHTQQEAASAAPQTPPAFEDQVRMALAKFGGWNHAAAAWVNVLAQRHGVPPDQVEAVILRITGAHTQQDTRHRADPMSAPSRPTRAKPRATRPGDQAVFAGIDEEPAPAPGTPSMLKPLLILLGVAGVGVISIVALILALVNLGSSPSKPPLPPPAPIASEEPRPAQSSTPSASTQPGGLFPAARAQTPVSPPPRPDRPSEWGDVLRDLKNASDLGATDPDQGQKAFLLALDAMMRRWPEAGSDGVLAGANHVIDYLYRLGPRQDLALDLVDAIAAPGLITDPKTLTDETLTRAAWSAGMLTRLSREKELGSASVRRLSDRVSEVLGASLPATPTFQNGAAAALARQVDHLIPEPQLDEPAIQRLSHAWGAWIRCLEAIDARAGKLHDRTILLALERLMIQGPDPTFSLATTEAIRQLTLALSWRAEGEARGALLRWLDTESISTPDLNVLTTALGTGSSAEGVDISFVLPTKAGWHDRTELRERLAAAWGGGPAVSRNEMYAQWGTNVRPLLGPATEGTPQILRLARAARLARMNATASKLWAGEAVGTRDLSPELEQDLEMRLQSVTQTTANYQYLKTDGSWPARYAQAGQSLTAKRDLWGQLNAPLSPPEAEMLAEDAVRGSPSQLRAEAAIVAQKFSADRGMINALLELVPFLPATSETTQFIQRIAGGSLPSPRDPSWRPSIRRLLVDRLIMLVAGTSEQSAADPLSDVIAHAYLASYTSGLPATPDAITPPASPPDAPTSDDPASTSLVSDAIPADQAASLLRARWEQWSTKAVPSGREPFSPAQLAARRAARAGMASGPIQRFHAEQVGIAELMAYVIAAEHPDKAAAAGEIITNAHDRRRRANHALEQIEIVEEAITRLWLLRLGEAGS